MSDVSGIPYMGPMGQGNFFAPSFSYNPQMSAGQIQSNYMPEASQGQSVLNNLYASGGGFGKQTDYYSQLGANYSAAGQGPIFNTSNAGTGLTISQLQQPWLTPEGGVNNVFSGGGSYQGPPPIGNIPTINWDSLGGGGAYNYGSLFGGGGTAAPPSAYSYGSLFGGGGADMFGGLAGGMGGAYQGPNNQIDWTHLFGGGGGGGARADPAPGMTMPGGLNSPMSTPQQPSIDWTSGGARADPAPGMTMPGGLNAPMTAQQQQPIDFGSLFGRGVGGTGAPGGSVFDTGAAPVIGTQDTGPYGGGAGIGGLDTGRAIGAPYTAPAEPNQFPLSGPQVAEAYNPYYGVTSPYSQSAGDQAAPTDTRTGGALTPGGGLTATDLSAQAREQLTKLMSGAKEPSVADVFAGDKPVPTEGQPAPTETAVVPTDPYAELLGEAGRGGMVGRPEAATSPATDVYPGANPPRPPADIPLHGRGVERTNPRLIAAVQGGATFLPPGYHIEAVSGNEPRPFGYHPKGMAVDVRIIGPDGAIPHQGEDTTGMYTLLARGVKTWVQQNDPALGSQMGYGGAFGTRGGKPGEVPDLMHYDLGGSRGQMRPDVQYGVLQPLTEAERNAMPANIPELGANQVALDVPNARTSGEATARAAPPLPAESPATQTYPGADAPRPPADIPDPRVVGGGFNALDAAAGPSGVEKAQTFLNRPVESILQQYSPENLSRAGWVMDLKQPMREALKGPFGGQILSGLQPKLGDLGLTRSDFAKAVADPRARFGGDFGASGGGELPSPGAFKPYEGWRQQSPDFEYRGDEQPGRDQLAELQTQGTNYELPEVASTPIGRELGLENLGRGVDTSTVQRLLGYTPQQWPDEAYPQPTTSGGTAPAAAEEFTPTRSITERAPSAAAEEMQRRYGGVGNPDVGPPQYSGFEQPYGSQLAPGAYTREQFENRADYTAQDQAERLAAGREMAGAQLAADPAMERRLIDTIQAEVGRNASDQERAALVESLLNRQTFNRDFRTDARVNRPDAAGRDWTDLGRLGLLSTGEDSYYQPFRSYGGTVTPTIQAAHAEVERDPAYAAHLRELVSQVIYGGSNVSNLATGNASDIRGGQQMGTDARQTQAPGWYAPTPQETFAREIGSSAARNWSQSLVPSGYTDPMSRAQRWQSIVANPYGGR